MNIFLSFLHLTPQNIIPLWLDLSAVIVGAISGSLVGISRKLDLIGVVACAILTGLGGGLVRDLTMQVGDVYLLNSPYAILSVTLAGVVVFFFHGFLEKFPNTLEWIDIFSVALFVVVGANKAIMYQLSPIAVVFMGTMTGVGGGMLRDSMIGKIPQIFMKSNFYATCAILGSIVFEITNQQWHLASPICVVATVFAVVVLRRLSLRYNWKSPAEVDLSAPILKAFNHKK